MDLFSIQQSQEEMGDFLLCEAEAKKSQKDRASTKILYLFDIICIA